uniref:Knottin scorpion toxin-like domain-containing protein n=1 Tax=Oryza brachyantha TaxID=4533 RepID=J3LI97_ORYBR
MAISRPPFCLALVAVAALLSSKMVVIQDDPKCEVMERCSVDNCTAYCVSIGLQQIGFCTFRDLQFYCCCPI